MKKITFPILLLFCTIYCYSQDEKNKMLSLTPLYINVSEEMRLNSKDTNAIKLGYIPWELRYKNKKKIDTVWMQENVWDVEDANKWLYIGMAVNKNRWYLYHEPVYNEFYILRTWVRITRPKIVRNKKVYLQAYELYLMEIDLKNKKYKTIQNVLYTAEGKKLGENKDEEEYEYPTPESLMETIIKITRDKYLKK